MKSFEIKALGLEEMSLQETEATAGGELLLAAITIIGAAIYVYNNWDDLKEGLKEGYSQTREQ